MAHTVIAYDGTQFNKLDKNFPISEAKMIAEKAVAELGNNQAKFNLSPSKKTATKLASSRKDAHVAKLQLEHLIYENTPQQTFEETLHQVIMEVNNI